MERSTAIKLLQLGSNEGYNGGVLSITMPGYHYAGQNPEHGTVVVPQHHPVAAAFMKEHGISAQEIIDSDAFRTLVSNPETNTTTIELQMNEVEGSAKMSYARARRPLQPGEQVEDPMPENKALDTLAGVARYIEVAKYMGEPRNLPGTEPSVRIKVPYNFGKACADEAADALVALGAGRQMVHYNNGLGADRAHFVMSEGGTDRVTEAMKAGGVNYVGSGLTYGQRRQVRPE